MLLVRMKSSSVKTIIPFASIVADFNSTPITITVLPGDTDVTVSIPIINDTIVEGEERFDVLIEASGIGVAVGYPRQAEVTIAGKKSEPHAILCSPKVSHDTLQALSIGLRFI